MTGPEAATVRVTASVTGLTTEHRVVWARLGRFEAVCAQPIAGGTARPTATTI
ncbi:hypothetical protein [Curtobacterium sp. MCBD17_021]|uniref:hypothetical protein n=1 Tax=Curtobacterium sp. MCBD17_021 TaxID=2175665 RepID=UPI0015E89332|nr:hypothetical protein [Curtobacterium sp. MCBD17_021]